MELRECYRMLDLKPGATLEEVRRAYKDAVLVWHPDRFVSNRRLKAKAEKKLKEINEAYETLEMHLSRLESPKQEHEKHKSGSRDEGGSKTEAIAEISTRLVLHACHFIVNAIKKRMD